MVHKAFRVFCEDCICAKNREANIGMKCSAPIPFPILEELRGRKVSMREATEIENHYAQHCPCYRPASTT